MPGVQGTPSSPGMPGVTSSPGMPGVTSSPGMPGVSSGQGFPGVSSGGLPAQRPGGGGERPRWAPIAAGGALAVVLAVVAFVVLRGGGGGGDDDDDDGGGGDGVPELSLLGTTDINLRQFGWALIPAVALLILWEAGKYVARRWLIHEPSISGNPA